MNERHEEGFALPVTIFALVIAAVLIAGSTFVVHQETRIGAAVRFGAEAFYLADEGVAEIIAGWDAAAMLSMVVWSDTTLVDTIGSGFTSTRVTRLASRLYLIESTAQVTQGGAVLSGATRENGTVVRLFSAQIDPPAALTTRGPTELKGNSEVDGSDETPPGWGAYCSAPGNNKPGILIDDATNVSTSGQGSYAGAPPLVEDATISDSTFTEFGELTWDDLVSMADKTVPPGTINGTGPVSSGGVCTETALTNWGDVSNPSGPCGNYFPIIHIPGNARIQSGGEGQGLLLVDGDLDLRGNFAFHGIVIVQGELGTQGNGNRVFGGVIAGNANIDTQTITGGSEITNSSCAVERALLNNSALTRPRPLGERSWVDLSAVKN